MDELTILSDELTDLVPEQTPTPPEQEEITQNAVTSDQPDLNVEEVQEDAADQEQPPIVEEPSKPSEPDEQAQIRALQADLARLQSELEAQTRAFERMTQECAEFARLFPDYTLASLPDEVWEGVRNGTPLAAAFALYQVKAAHRARMAEQVNSRNRLVSSGGVSGDGDQFLSPTEVRRMNPSQVRENYSKIIESMKLWN